ncbi:Glyoxalase/Bleomycin resistance protein/Dihydroxybiphenyl dioxygenase [Pyrenochaeta sp. MPI-SDFR-AT-0127]|nr:Glyoxalase/Bleomycin resistance protein/Dihydroxybiphenyl dioxygenase [Pyrenochaeta sp. MPI-SDFR-AT-0127]
MAPSNANHPPGPYVVGEHIIPPPRPNSPATAEYRLNHLMLRIKDPQKSLGFYCDCLGLHVVFIFNAGPWTIYYLGPRDAGMATLGTSKGLLELYHIPSDASTAYVSGNDYSAPGVGFGHVGFTVPDVAEALDRVRSFGYEIIKPLDEAREEQMGLSDEVVKGKFGGVNEGYKHIFRQLAFVQDPDGYWVELVPQVVKPPG